MIDYEKLPIQVQGGLKRCICEAIAKAEGES